LRDELTANAIALGEGEGARSWAETELEELIRVGGPRYLKRLTEQIAGTRDRAHLKALGMLRGYLEGNQDRMWYAQRLREGKPIGSGAIEGACKKVPGGGPAGQSGSGHCCALNMPIRPQATGTQRPLDRQEDALDPINSFIKSPTPPPRADFVRSGCNAAFWHSSGFG
jgi:hypothetical protein